MSGSSKSTFIPNMVTISHSYEEMTYTSLKFRGSKTIYDSISPISGRFRTSVFADLTPNRVWPTRITQNFFILTLPEKVNFFDFFGVTHSSATQGNRFEQKSLRFCVIGPISDNYMWFLSKSGIVWPATFAGPVILTETVS